MAEIKDKIEELKKINGQELKNKTVNFKDIKRTVLGNNYTVKPVKTGKKQATSGSFKPGQSGNPNGRPKGVTEAAKLKRAFKDFVDDEELVKIMEHAIARSYESDKILEYVCNHLIGKPKETIDIDFKEALKVVLLPTINETTSTNNDTEHSVETS